MEPNGCQLDLPKVFTPATIYWKFNHGLKEESLFFGNRPSIKEIRNRIFFETKLNPQVCDLLFQKAEEMHLGLLYDDDVVEDQTHLIVLRLPPSGSTKKTVTNRNKRSKPDFEEEMNLLKKSDTAKLHEKTRVCTKCLGYGHFSEDCIIVPNFQKQQ